MTLRALLPVKGFERAKSRLSSALAAPARAGLAQSMLETALDALSACGVVDGVVVATDGDDVAALCEARDVEVLRDPPGTKLSLAQVIDRALDTMSAADAGGEVLILMADLPHVEEGDLVRLIDRPRHSDLLFVPDRRGRGTNALLLPLGTPFRTHFGHPDSLALHLAEADRHGMSVAIVESARIAFDLDRPAELEGLQAAEPAAPLRSGDGRDD